MKADNFRNRLSRNGSTGFEIIVYFREFKDIMAFGTTSSATGFRCGKKGNRSLYSSTIVPGNRNTTC